MQIFELAGFVNYVWTNTCCLEGHRMHRSKVTPIDLLDTGWRIFSLSLFWKILVILFGILILSRVATCLKGAGITVLSTGKRSSATDFSFIDDLECVFPSCNRHYHRLKSIIWSPTTIWMQLYSSFDWWPFLWVEQNLWTPRDVRFTSLLQREKET